MAWLLTLRREGGPELEGGKGKETDSSPEPLEGIQPCCHLDFKVSDPIMQYNKPILFQATTVEVTFYSSNRKLIQT